MLRFLKNIIKKEIFPVLKSIQFSIRKIIFKISGPAKVDFDYETLPDFDKGFPLEEIIRSLDIPKNLPYNLLEKLQFFHEHGYVVLEQIIDHKDLDGVWNQVEEVQENNEKYEIEAIAHRYNNQQDTPIKDIPKEKLKGIGSRINDFHDYSKLTKEVSSNPSIRVFLEAILEKNVAVFQSLVFKYSSQQGLHQDFPWVTTSIPSHLAAAWIPLEDVHADSGPLVYYPGSHRMPKFDFGKTGILYKGGQSLMHPEKDFTSYLEKTVKELGYKKEILLIKKGDVLIWHGALAHAGSPILDPNRTRKSLVVHYSSLTALPQHRNSPTEDNEAEKVNGVTFYTNNRLKHLKNIL
ncbi:MAG: hypothetical protein RI995_1296 [Bacteroidota bacterium]